MEIIQGLNKIRYYPSGKNIAPSLDDLLYVSGVTIVQMYTNFMCSEPTCFNLLNWVLHKT